MRCSASPGVQGNGQTELIEAIMGLRPVLAGTVTPRRRADRTAGRTKKVLRAGRRLRARGPQRRRPGQGVQRRGEPGARHLRPAAVRQGPGAEAGRDRRRRPRSGSSSSTSVPPRRTRRWAPSPAATSRRSIVARELSRPLKLFIAAQPTRGVDVGSIEFIHSRVIRERDIGTAVMVVSSELDEVIGAGRPDRGDVPGPDHRHRRPGHPARGDRPADGRHHPRRGHADEHAADPSDGTAD